MSREKELQLLNDSSKIPPEDDFLYEVFFRKHILPLELTKCEEKRDLIREYCKQKNLRAPSYTYDPLDDDVLFESDSSLEEEDKIAIKNLGTLKRHASDMKEIEEATQKIDKQVKDAQLENKEIDFIKTNKSKFAPKNERRYRISRSSRDV